MSPASSESLVETPSPPGLATSKKRKLEVLSESRRSIKKKKKPRKANEDQDETLNLEQGVNTSIAKFDNRLLADFVAQRTKRFDPGLTLVELEDRHIPGRFARSLP